MTTGQSRAIKVIAIVFAVYVGIVVLFESLLGYFQPEGGDTVVITTSANGQSHDRVLSLLKSDDQLYVAANHWPRAWYKRALANPDVELTMDGERAAYRAVLLTGSDHDRASETFAVGLFFRVLTGFPPRYFVRLDPVTPPGPAPGAMEDAREHFMDDMEHPMEHGVENSMEGATGDA